MLKSELLKRISARNPHLYDRDIEKVVNAILTKWSKLCVVEIESNCGVSEPFQLLRGPRQGRNPRTGAAVAVAKKAVPLFKTGKEMRERLNQETVPSD